MSIDAKKLREFALRYTAAWCSGKPERVASFFAPDGRIGINGTAPSVGRAAIAEMARGFMQTFPDLKVSMDNLIIQPAGAVYHWTLDGTNTAPGGTGKSVHISGFEQWKIGSDGLIAESEGTFDSADYERQLKSGYDPRVSAQSQGKP